MKRILHILSGNNTFSGVASYLYQQYIHIDRDKVRYDFFFCKENSMEPVMNDVLFQDSKFYVSNARMKKTGSTNYLKIMRDLNKILMATKYDAVVVNTSIIMINYVCLRVVRKHTGVRFIAHAHNTGLVLNKGALRNRIMPIVRFIDNLLRKRIRVEAYALFGCSEEAGKATFGQSVIQLEKFKIVRNAIDIAKFRYNESIAKSVRREMGIDDSTLIIGNVGRLANIKNQRFLIEVFSTLKKQKQNSKLWLIGDGPDKVMLMDLAKTLKVENDVIFLGQKLDVYRYLQAMDLFVFPSLSEGLGIVAIEAQAAGLPVVVSNGVPKDVMLTPLVRMISLSENSESWANELLSLYEEIREHFDYNELLMNAGYDIETTAHQIMEYYLNSI